MAPTSTRVGIGVRFRTNPEPYVRLQGGGHGHRGGHGGHVATAGPAFAHRRSRAPPGVAQPTYRTYRGPKLHRRRPKTTGGCKMTSSGAKVASGGGGVARGAMAAEEFSWKFPEKEGVERNFGELRAKKALERIFRVAMGWPWPPGWPPAGRSCLKQKDPIPTLIRRISNNNGNIYIFKYE